MKELKKARMGMIAMLTVMLVSITRRLPEARRLSSGITTLALAGIVLLVAAGGASAAEPITECQEITTPGEYYLANDIIDTTTANVCIYITADDVTLDGQGCCIDGSTPGSCGPIGGLSDPTYPSLVNGYARAGISVKSADNVLIKDVEVKNFCNGILLYGTSDNNTVTDCIVHDNGNPTTNVQTGGDFNGISVFNRVCNSYIIDNTIYDNTGELASDCDDNGAGISVKKFSNYNHVTNNTVFGNTFAGIYLKKGGGDCFNIIDYNRVYENGQAGGGETCFTGGIRLQCKSTDDNTIECNTVWDNFGPGIFVGGSDCEVRNNTVTGNKDAYSGNPGYGLYVDRYSDGGGRNAKVYDNVFCDNEDLDIKIQDAAADPTGDRNTCYTSLNYNDDGMATGCDYACIISCDSAGNAKDEFDAGEKVYAKGGGYGLTSGTEYKLWIQDDPVSDGDALASDPSGSQETVTPANDGDGVPCFGMTTPVEIWDTGANPAGLNDWDIIADKQGDGANTDKYNRASDGIDSSTVGTKTMPGFVAPIPEVATFALVGIGLLGLGGLVRRRKD